MSKTENNLSDAQAKALATITERYVQASAAEVARWGKELVGGVCVADILSCTVLALESRGLITVERVTTHGSRLRHTGFGRWNGAERTTTVTLYAKPRS